MPLHAPQGSDRHPHPDSRPARRLELSAPPSSSLVHPLSGVDLDGAQLVFVGIVAVRGRKWKRGVRVLFPSPREVYRLVDAADLVVTTELQSDGVVFAVADIGKSNLPQHRDVKSSRRAQA